MKFKQKLNITKEEMYKFLIENLDTKKKVYKGLKINKEVSVRLSKITSTIEVTDLEQNKVFELTYTTPYNKSIVRYDLSDIPNEDGVIIDYVEKSSSDSKLTQLNDTIVSIFLGWYLKRKRKKTLKLVEQYIVGRR